MNKMPCRVSDEKVSDDPQDFEDEDVCDYRETGEYESEQMGE